MAIKRRNNATLKKEEGKKETGSIGSPESQYFLGLKSVNPYLTVSQFKYILFKNLQITLDYGTEGKQTLYSPSP